MLKIKKKFSSQNIKIFNQITKSKLSLMNSGVVLYGYILTTPLISSPTLLTLFAGTFTMAMATQVKGQILEKNFDSKMDRTKMRPLPLNKITIKNANFLNYFLFLSSNFILFFGGIGFWPIFINNVTYFSYWGYVRSKVKSVYNTILGSFPGSFPILIGVTEGVDLAFMDSSCYFTFGYLFFWNIVHFYAIYISFYEDYRKTDFKNFEIYRIPFIMVFCSLLQLIFFYFWLNDMDLDSESFFNLLFFSFCLQYASVFNNLFKYIKTQDVKYGSILRNISYRMLFTTFIIVILINLQNKYKNDSNLTK